ncbi:hypothetical protein C8A00DRAFT_11476 [Chaetomidium leptoderma]|uniref:Uncharacterized protein n=1 Tax=Chaetomidium leptoderma TaxID=669021 RepID=A0AAN6VWZ8_9PEZI|nr:hypothetical protein C8A00DRAFT_11476 [Chaetomidium leptoderma]
MPPPNTPEEGLTAPATQSVYADPFRAPSPHPSSAIAHASQGESCIQELDYQSIEYIEPVDDTLLCPVCKTPFHSPITTPCGHTFCAGCINRALETQPTCPIDRQPINKTRDYHRLPLIIKDQLDRLKVKCPNKGCDHVCPREHLEGHYERRCDFTLVRCPEPNCSRLIARRDATPAKGCLHRNVACEFCHKSMIFAELDAHYDHDCDGATTKCPGCETDVPRHRLGKHQSEDCAEGQTQCRWQAAGCVAVDKRWVIEAHQSSGCPFEVVGRLLEQRAEDRKIIDDLTRRLSSLEAARARRRDVRERRTTEMALINGAALPSLMSPASTDVPDLTLNDNMPIFPGATAADNGMWSSPENYMLAQFERFETQMEELRKQTRDMEARQSINTLQHTTLVNEQMGELASRVGVLNMHTTWLMNMQRQSHAQQRAGGSNAGGPPNSSGMSHSSDTSVSAARPGSSSDSGTTRYQGGSRRNSDGRGETLTRL